MFIKITVTSYFSLVRKIQNIFVINFKYYHESCFPFLKLSYHVSLSQISEGQSYDFGSCPELSDPVGIHPSTKNEVQAGWFEVVKSEDEVVVTTLCDESSGWILADSRFQQVR